MKKIVSFDIWDTIIKRKCHPEEVKLYTAKYIFLKYQQELKEEYKNIYVILKKRNEIELEICKENEKCGKDAECTIIGVFEKLQEEIFKDSIHINIADELLQEELSQEKRVIYVNPDILPMFEKYKKLKMYCISDFYMGSKELEELIRYLKLNVKFEKIFSSADYLLNKKTGRLFLKAEEELKILPEEHIHIGDNKYSDIEIANKLGIETLKIEKQEIEFTPNKNRNINLKLDDIKIEEKCINDKLYNLGIKLSPILYFFGYSVVEYAIKNNIKNVFYCTREGETFIKIHELMKKNNPFQIEIPSSDILEVSRMATFSASLKELSIQELLRLWSQYRNQSMSSLFKTLAIDIGQYQKYFDKYEIKAEEIIQEPWFNPKIQLLFKDKDFCNDINKKIKLKRMNLLEYFQKSKKITNNNDELFIVDIGWRGTIQDNLAYIFNNKKIIGYYLTLYDFYNMQPYNTEKIGFIDDRNIRDEYVSDIITILEWIYNPGTASVTSYEEGKAIRKAKKDETKVVNTYVLPMQKGMIAGAEKINEYMIVHPFQSEETKNYIYELIKEIKEKPTKDLVNIYYNMVFNDTFGSGEYIEKKNKIGLLTKINLIKCRRILNGEMWKEAYMKYNKIEYMKIILDIGQKIKKILKGK